MIDVFQGEREISKMIESGWSIHLLRTVVVNADYDFVFD